MQCKIINYIQYNLTISITVAISCIEKFNNTSWQDVYWQFLYHTHVIVHCLNHCLYTFWFWLSYLQILKIEKSRLLVILQESLYLSPYSFIVHCPIGLTSSLGLTLFSNSKIFCKDTAHTRKEEFIIQYTGKNDLVYIP